MKAPLKVDYPTDNDEEDDVGFEIKVPDLSDLVNEFEKDDDLLYKITEEKYQRENECRLKGLVYD